MKKLLKWADQGVTLVVSGILIYLLLTKFVLPRASDSIDPTWQIARGQPTLLAFSTSTCPSCLAMRPILLQVKNHYRGKVLFKTLAFDDTQDSAQYETQRLAAEFGVRMTPTFVIAGADGKVTARFQGPVSYASLVQALDHVTQQKEPQ